MGKSGRRRVGAWALLIFAVCTTLVATILPTVFQFSWSRPSPHPFLDFLTGFSIAPFVYGFLLFRYNLIEAIYVLVGALVLNAYATRHLPLRRACITAAFLGFMAPVMAIGAQSLWAMAAMSRGADALQADCVQRRPLLEIVTQVSPDLVANHRLFGSFHALARKGDQVWYWSFREWSWIAYDPNRTKAGEDPRPLITCPQ